MNLDDSKSFDQMAKSMVNRKVTMTGDRLKFHDVAQFRFTKDALYSMDIKYTYDDKPFQRVSLLKRGRPPVNVPIPVKRKKEQPIPKNKLDDVMSLLPFTPAVHHSFYTNIVTDKTTVSGIEMLDEEAGDSYQ